MKQKIILDLGGDSIRVTRSLFQEGNGGAIPTSPLQLEIRQIDKNMASQCYKKWHYLGDKGFLASINFGVFTEDMLWGCISFGIPNARNIKGIYDQTTQSNYMELTRLALSDYLPKFSESRVIGITIKLLKKAYPNLKGIITYADIEQGHTGVIYKATNFKYMGITAQKTDLFVNGKKFGKQKGVKYSEVEGEWRKRSQKHFYFMGFR